MGACHPAELLVADKVVEQTASKLDYGRSCLGKGFGVAAKKAAEKSARDGLCDSKSDDIPFDEWKTSPTFPHRRGTLAEERHTSFCHLL